ncbi:hypothetical protein TcWFU_002366 [Taenia crassiceps]|uniref:Uncharacterized protein n=1 Tax=Taenia crassiceps TaxID=6207 RepID=A0ABR4Q3A6_9CEST
MHPCFLLHCRRYFKGCRFYRRREIALPPPPSSKVCSFDYRPSSLCYSSPFFHPALHFARLGGGTEELEKGRIGDTSTSALHCFLRLFRVRLETV